MLHLIEQRNFSLVAFLGERTPTGNAVNGNNINYLTPSLEGWWNFAYKWVARGATGINVRTNHIPDIADVYFNRLSIGRYVTEKMRPFLKTWRSMASSRCSMTSVAKRTT